MIDLNNKKVGCPLSGGINSMAVLCWLIESGMQPSELHIQYHHFKEHSPGTFPFVADGMRLARKHFPNVFLRVTRNSVLDFFEANNMIPHPTISPCSQQLKIEPSERYSFEHGIEVNLIGYVRTEKRRISRSTENTIPSLFIENNFPLSLFDDEWCFDIVKKHIGWVPQIYSLKWNDEGFCNYIQKNLSRFDEYTQRKLLNKVGNDKRVFLHNNCLPCKNMQLEDLLAVEYFYPEYMQRADELAKRLKNFWGRNADAYYTTFGREDYEAPRCEVCQFD